jgi:dihydropteroate synthase
MIYKPLNITPADSLPATIALDAIALERGAAIIRVHDVAPAVQSVAVMELLSKNS